ncbi:MAG: alpha/beta fold hydrolase [Candidatus Eremiobacteraeota bacterium]|nr:alpha/beta fold hydrolase [Candidatus Eremiobacteraeota bacterium]MCW5868105.1 alpha/beta fold hydrolase [Candidatus Eremiobacteraeota bacterium]
MKRLLCWLAVCGAVAAEPIQIPVGTDYSLPGRLDIPAGARGVVVLLHGSGAANMDEELQMATKDKAPNPFFADLSAALQGQKLAVLRYDKRNFALSQRNSEAALQSLKEHPGLAYIQDALSAVAVARQKCPGLPVFLLGHSEGTWVAQQAARQDGQIQGLGLIGFTGSALETLVSEQIAYRPLDYFNDLDKNHDRVLQPEELNDALRPQLVVLDLNRDGNLSRSEFQAGNFSQLLLKPLLSDAWRRDEASLPAPLQLVEQAEIPLVFLQGEWDNQTPAFVVQALDICESRVWKKGNKRFVYFPGCGHALDARDRYDDVVYRRPDQATLERAAGELARFWFQR